MKFPFVVARSATSSSVVCRAARRSPRAARLASALTLIAAALPACAGGAPVSDDDLQLNDGESPASSSAAPSASAAEASAAMTEAITSAALESEGADPGELTLAAASGDDSDSAGDDGAEEPTTASPPNDADDPSADPPVPGETMRTSGRRLLDACGNVFVTRGVEQIFGNELPEGNDWLGLMNQIAASGVNAVRILVGSALGTSDVDALLDAVAEHDMVAYIAPYGSEGGEWLAHSDVKAMLDKHQRYILIDAFGEPTFDDRDRFVSEASASLQRVRDLGYRVPLTVTANQFGRDLPSLLELGPEILAADPLHNTVFGWQAYWSTNGYYQSTYGYSLEQGVAAAAAAPFPIQLGLDRVTDFPSDVTADFGTLMNATEANGIGWLWWDWYNPYGNENNLTEDGSVTELTPTGQTVIDAHPASVKNTARYACRPR